LGKPAAACIDDQENCCRSKLPRQLTTLHTEGHNQQFILGRGCFAPPFCPFLLSLFPSLSTRCEVVPSDRAKRFGGMLLLLPPVGGERNLQPPDTFPGF